LEGRGSLKGIGLGKEGLKHGEVWRFISELIRTRIGSIGGSITQALTTLVGPGSGLPGIGYLKQEFSPGLFP